MGHRAAMWEQSLSAELAWALGLVPSPWAWVGRLDARWTQTDPSLSPSSSSELCDWWQILKLSYSLVFSPTK